MASFDELLKQLEGQYGISTSAPSNIGDIQSAVNRNSTTGSISSFDSYLNQLESEYKNGPPQPQSQQQVQQPQAYQGPIEEGSPLGFGQRIKTGFGDIEGIKNYVQNLGYEPLEDEQGNVLVKKEGKVYRLDEKGFSFGDIADVVGKALPLGGSILGAIAGGIGAGAGTFGVGAVAGGAAGGAVGGGIGETARQAIGKSLEVNAPGGGIGEIARESVYGGIAGATAGVGNVLARSATRLTPELLGRTGLEASGTLLGRSVEPVGTVLSRTTVPRLGTKLAGEAVEAGLQGGIISGGQTLVDTGDVGEAAKAFGVGFALGAPFGPIGYAAMSPIAPYLERVAARVGASAEKLNPYRNPYDIKNKIARELYIEIGSDPMAVVRKFGKEGDVQTIENIFYHRAVFTEKATDNIAKGWDVWNGMSTAEKNEMLRLYSLSKKGYSDLETLLNSTQNPKVKEAINYLFEAHKDVSESLRGRTYVDEDTKEIIRFADKGPAPFIPHVRETPTTGNLEEQIQKLLKEDIYKGLPKEVAIGKARKRAEAMFANIKGVKKGIARKNFQLASIDDYENAGLLSNPFEAMTVRAKKDIIIAAYAKELGDIFDKIPTPEDLPPALTTRIAGKELVISPEDISLNSVEDVLVAAGYPRLAMRKLINDVAQEVGLKRGADGKLVAPLEFSDVEKLKTVLDRELSKYGKTDIAGKVAKENTDKIISTLKQEGVEFRGMQETGDTPLVLFDDPQTGSTLALKSTEVNAKNIKNKLEESRAKFGVKIPPKLTKGDDTDPKEFVNLYKDNGFTKEETREELNKFLKKNWYEGLSLKEKSTRAKQDSLDYINNYWGKEPELDIKKVVAQATGKKAGKKGILKTEQPLATEKPAIQVSEKPKAGQERVLDLEDLEIPGDEVRTMESQLTAAIRGKFDDMYKAIDSHYEGDPLEAAKIKKYLDRVFKIMSGDTGYSELAGTIKAVSALKFSLSFLRQPVQLLNNLLRGDLSSFSKGLRAILTQTSEMDFAGHTMTPIQLAESAGARKGTPIWDFDKSSKFRGFVDKVLTPLTKSEQSVMRISSSVTGAKWAENLANTFNKHLDYDSLDQLTKLIRKEPTMVNGEVKLSLDDIQRAAYFFTKDTQFGFDPLRIPYFANTPMGSVIFMGKGFGFNQARLVLDQTIGELQAGRPGRATRNLLILAMLFPPAGFTTQSLINVLTGKENEKDITSVNGWIGSIADAGAMGLLTDIAQSPSGPAFVAGLAAGPAGGTLSDAYEVFIGNKGIDDFIARTGGGAGRVLQKTLTGENIIGESLGL